MTATWQLGPYTVTRDPDCLLRGLETIKLPKRHLDTLLLLVEAEGEVVSKETFFKQVWGGLHVEEGNLSQTIFLLRKTLGRLPNGGEYIETMPRRGYRLVPGIVLQVSSAMPVLTEILAPVDPPRAETEPAPEDAVAEPAPPEIGRRSFAHPGWRSRAYRAALLVVLAGVLATLWRAAKTLERPRLVRTLRLTNDGMYKEQLAPLLADGRRLYFTEIYNNQNRLGEVSVLGGFTMHRPSPAPERTAIAVSRWHDGILLGKTWEAGNSLMEEPMVVLTDDGAMHQLGHVSGHSAAWSPDGQHLVFASAHALLMADGNGEHVRQLSRLPEVPFWPVWSSDGRKIRFSVQGQDTSTNLWEIDAAGGSMRPVLHGSSNAGRACCGQWSPNGHWFVYVTNDQNRSSLWLRREQGLLSGREFEIASGPMDFWRSPLFSDDGRQIYAIGEQARGELMRYDQTRQLWSPALAGLSADTLKFSPDRGWIAYTQYPEGSVWRSRSDGTAKLQLSAPGEIGRFPHWSPDSKRIVYMGARPNQPWLVMEVEASGARSPRTVLQESVSQGAATYSPDGRRVAFGRIMAYGIAVGSDTGISVVDLQSGHVDKLPGSEGLWTARWSPDGRWIAATTADRQRLMLYDWTSGQWTSLATEGVNDLIWNHDGSSLFFDSHNGREATIFRVTLADRSVHRYADLSGLQRTGFAGWRLSLDADDQVMVLRQGGTMEVYRLDLELPD